MRSLTYWRVFIFIEWAYFLEEICNKRYLVWGCWENRRGFSASINLCLSCQVFGFLFSLRKMWSQSSKPGFKSYPLMIPILWVSHPLYKCCPSFILQYQCYWWICCNFRRQGIEFNGHGLWFPHRPRCFSWLTVWWSFAWSCWTHSVWRQNWMTQCPCFLLLKFLSCILRFFIIIVSMNV